MSCFHAQRLLKAFFLLKFSELICDHLDVRDIFHEIFWWIIMSLVVFLLGAFPGLFNSRDISNNHEQSILSINLADFS
jgi:hypothetical protein